ncbi:AMP-binding protein [Brenneria sp. g21c3]|uniref:AMP-binding protein n=1 Tax=Brenneria sp. g21c3 TaxID=3093893 RepID=UPI002EC126D3|nr:AMP-binding protein [Brenneria sp. g21c3]
MTMSYDKNYELASDRFGEAFWRAQAELLDWHTPFQRVVERVDNGPRSRWFIGGKTNLCHNALDRHLAEKADKTALIHCDYAGKVAKYTYRQLHQEVLAMAWILHRQSIGVGDRIFICLPMIPLAAIAMLACCRLGALHVVVYSGLTSEPLAQRIQASRPKAIVKYGAPRDRHTDEQLMQALRRSGHHCSVIDVSSAGFQQDYARRRGKPLPCRWLPSETPSHLLYTSGTTGLPKGIVRDTGGYAVALLASLQHIFHLDDDEIFFTSADVGWVTGHSYGIYAPLLAGITTVLVEASRLNKPGARWWRLVEQLGITRMLTIPGAMRLARRQRKTAADIRSLRAIYLAGEPLDAPTRQWVSDFSGIQAEDHYWQTESGWPILAGAAGELRPVLPRDVTVLDDISGAPCADNVPGMLVIRDTLGPGGMQTVWRDDVEHDQRYWRQEGDRWLYFTHDRAVRNPQGAICVLGRMDDVINVGGKRLSTVEIERTIMVIDGVSEAAAVGMAHSLLGQMVGLYVVTPYRTRAQRRALQQEIRRRVINDCGRHALPRHIYFVVELPRTFSGKVIRKQLAV